MIHSIFYKELGEIEKYPWGFWREYKHRELAASICHTRMEYKEMFPGSYLKSIKNINEMDKFQEMFFEKQKTFPKFYWNSYENRLNAAKQCKTQKEYFNKFPGAYDKSRKIKNEMQYFRDNVFDEKNTPKNYWKEYKHRENAASTCRSKSEYAQKYPVAYKYSRKNIDEFDNFTKRFFTNTFIDDDSKIYLIYVYLDYSLMIGYCGLTRQTIKLRDGQHRKKSDRLYKLFVEVYHTIIPKPLIVSDKLNRIEAQEAEDYYKRYYEKCGFNMLNCGKTGKNIGSIGYSFKYNKEHCYRCAKQCTSIKEFRTQFSKEYQSASIHDWLKNYDWLQPEKFKKDVTYEECKELAKSCNTISEFCKKFPSESKIAQKNKWLYDFFGKPKTWDFESCKKESQKYTKRADFKKYSPSAYVISQRNNWLDSFTWLEVKSLNKRTFESFLNSVLKYCSKYDLKENDYKTFEALGKRKLYECFYNEDGTIKEYIKEMKINSEEYNKLKEIVNQKIIQFLNKHNENRKTKR